MCIYLFIDAVNTIRARDTHRTCSSTRSLHYINSAVFACVFIMYAFAFISLFFLLFFFFFFFLFFFLCVFFVFSFSATYIRTVVS